MLTSSLTILQWLKYLCLCKLKYLCLCKLYLRKMFNRHESVSQVRAHCCIVTFEIVGAVCRVLLFNGYAYKCHYSYMKARINTWNDFGKGPKIMDSERVSKSYMLAILCCIEAKQQINYITWNQACALRRTPISKTLQPYWLLTLWSFCTTVGLRIIAVLL